MNIPLAQAEEYAIGLREVADCYADRCAYALAMEIQRLRAQLDAQEQAIQKRGIALAQALGELDDAKHALELSRFHAERWMQKHDLRVKDWQKEQADNAALRSVVSSAVELLSADPTWDAAMAVVAQARVAMEDKP